MVSYLRIPFLHPLVCAPARISASRTSPLRLTLHCLHLSHSLSSLSLLRFLNTGHHILVLRTSLDTRLICIARTLSLPSLYASLRDTLLLFLHSSLASLSPWYVFTSLSHHTHFYYHTPLRSTLPLSLSLSPFGTTHTHYLSSAIFSFLLEHPYVGAEAHLHCILCLSSLLSIFSLSFSLSLWTPLPHWYIDGSLSPFVRTVAGFTLYISSLLLPLFITSHTHGLRTPFLSLLISLAHVLPLSLGWGTSHHTRATPLLWTPPSSLCLTWDGGCHCTSLHLSFPVVSSYNLHASQTWAHTQAPLHAFTPLSALLSLHILSTCTTAFLATHTLSYVYHSHTDCAERAPLSASHCTPHTLHIHVFSALISHHTLQLPLHNSYALRFTRMNSSSLHFAFSALPFYTAFCLSALISLYLSLRTRTTRAHAITPLRTHAALVCGTAPRAAFPHSAPLCAAHTPLVRASLHAARLARSASLRTLVHLSLSAARCFAPLALRTVLLLSRLSPVYHHTHLGFATCFSPCTLHTHCCLPLSLFTYASLHLHSHVWASHCIYLSHCLSGFTSRTHTPALFSRIFCISAHTTHVYISRCQFSALSYTSLSLLTAHYLSSFLSLHFTVLDRLHTPFSPCRVRLFLLPSSRTL